MVYWNTGKSLPEEIFAEEILEYWNTGIPENWNPGKFPSIIQYFKRKYWKTEIL